MTELTRAATRPRRPGFVAAPRQDEATRARDSKLAADDTEWLRLNDAWHAAYWRSQGWWQHQVITGSLPVLYDCFNHADLLISDISSVVSDFIAAGSPTS